jgi:nucleoside-diphosphate-sugar epimerase
MRLFLTGATGFVGRNLLLATLNGGVCEEIIVAVRDREKLERQLAAEGFPESPPRLRILDWGDAPPPDVTHAVHCAGVLFARNRAEYFRVNVDDTLRLVGGLPESARVLVLSSQSAGGPTPPGCEIRTSADPDTPLTWYGESKLAMERALADAHPGIRLWRPPMILGPRDRATLPLFQMAAGPLRIKPGLRAKTYSWIAVSDLVRAILRALQRPDWPALAAPLPVCAPETITDLELIATAAAVMDRKGLVLPLPHPLVRAVSRVVDAAPPLRVAAPSLTRDRVREIFPDRWVLDGSAFHRTFADGPFATLRDTLAETRAWYVRAGLLPAA